MHTKAMIAGRRGQEGEKLKLQLCPGRNCVPIVTVREQFRFCQHTFVTTVAFKVLIFLRGTVHTIWLPLFVMFPGIFSESKLWAQHCVNTISRFASLSELKCRNPCACFISPSVDIAENLRVLCVS